MAVALSGSAIVSGAATNTDVYTATGVTLAAGDVADVSIGWRESAAQTVSGVTFNGSSTGVTQTQTSSGNGERVGLARYRIVGVTGTGDVVATLSAVAESARIVVQKLTGVDNTTPVGTADIDVELGTDSGSMTGNVTIPSGGLAIASMISGGGDVTPMAPTAGQTVISAGAVFGTTTATMAVSYEPDSGDGALGYTWTTGVGGGYTRLSVVPYLAAAGGGGVVVPVLPQRNRRHTGRYL